jgi:DNA repair exonuclease SbcCD ATPase subunit
MKFGKCEVFNFGSYYHLTFDFSNQGLTLVYGPTGSGKSTLEDAAAWILFGITAKDGNADEVRNWTNLEEPTTGVLEVELKDGTTIAVVRKRGKSNQNDLYWMEEHENKRGKDVTETQKLLEQRLGVTSDLYLTGAYCHEFSQAGAFFLAKAKDRRKVFENIASLEFPAKLADSASARRKAVKASISKAQTAVDQLKGRLYEQQLSLKRIENSSAAWEKTNAAQLLDLKKRLASFDRDVAEKKRLAQANFDQFEERRNASLDKVINQLELMDEPTRTEEEINRTIEKLNLQLLDADKSTCKACGQNTGAEEQALLTAAVHELQQEKLKLKNHQAAVRILKRDLERYSNEANPHAKELSAEYENHYAEQLEKAKAAVNPFLSQISGINYDITNTGIELNDAELQLKELSVQFDALVTLQDLAADLRGELVRKTVQEIENSTNRYLETYFDGEIKVGFQLDGSDSVDVQIQKNGYECVYRQLSKGQRGLLRLCFVVSVMHAAANNAGVNFDTVFFDEALDGLDSSLKVKAYALFEELANSHGSVILIEHAQEFQNLFSNRYRVSMVEDNSEIQHES